MFLYKDGKFHTHGISFTVPDGFLVEPAPDVLPQNGLIAYTPDNDHRKAKTNVFAAKRHVWQQMIQGSFARCSLQ